MSMRRPACAPPPKIWISGIGSDTACRAGQVLPQRHAPARPPPPAPPPATPRRSRCRPAAPCWACRRARSASRRCRPGRARPCRRSRARSGRGRWRPPARRRSRRGACRRRAGRSPRASRATRPRARCPADRTARERDFGFDRRPAARIPDAARVHAGNAGVGHEAHGVRSDHRGQVAFARIRPDPIAVASDRCVPGIGDRGHRGGGAAIRVRRTTGPRAVGLRGQVLDRRLAVDAREHQPRQQRRRARVERGPRLPRDVARYAARSARNAAT